MKLGMRLIKKEILFLENASFRLLTTLIFEEAMIKDFRRELRNSARTQTNLFQGLGGSQISVLGPEQTFFELPKSKDL